jgi:Na+/H+ antiporter NhaD/arsenite permease-like protein
MSDAFGSTSSGKMLLATIVVVLAGYFVAAAFHLPQYGAEQIVAGESHAKSPDQSAKANGPAAAETKAATTPVGHPPYWMVIPFVLLLGSIALLPLIPATQHWWDSNLHRFYVAGGLAVLTLLYYVTMHAQPVQAHWPASHTASPSSCGLNWLLAGEVLANAVLNEYLPFIVLLFSLYTISGGIRIEGDLPAHPVVNVAFLAIGALLASLIGTTGAAMLLVRPLLETNRERRHVKHTVIFFTFIVCNCGGCLLPLGDPPLFLGYLMGVPFLWTIVLWKEWAFVNGMLLLIYLLWDLYWCYPREKKADVIREDTRTHRLRFGGLWPNVPLLLGILLSVALLDPAKPFPGTDWHPWLYLREIAQLALVGLSLALSTTHARRANRFNYGAIVEVAALFFGIFICMQPALQILGVEGPNLGLTQPWHYFWASGSLSSVLDNAPTYVVFFETAKSLTQSLDLTPQVAGVQVKLLIAVSLGSVFMGANTYIGNGPNFMVKSIAEKSGVDMPSFFGYMLYSISILLPLFALTNWIFLR